MKLARGESGQATLEYAIVAVILLGILVALAALFLKVKGGLFVEHALGSASHSLSSKNTIGFLGDLLLF